VISVEDVTKYYGETMAVDHLSFQAKPGLVTGFLGPNGSGKSTTMRVILDLDQANSGRATINGAHYRDLRFPLREVGALLDANAVSPKFTARTHLRALAASNQIPLSRVDEMLEFTGITSIATKKIADYSLGMRQRFGIAAALLGDPGVVLFDEPVNGLDPEGIRWFRGCLRSMADEGRTVLISLHLINELAQCADEVVVIGKG
jgi:ABC-2 type transport system ATP-binding protein